MSPSRRGILVSWVVGLLCCFVVVSVTRFTADLSAFLPRTPTFDEAILVDQLREGFASHVVLIGIEGASQGALAALSKDFANRLRRNRNFVSVNNGEDPHLADDQKFLWENRYLLSDGVVAERFTVEGLRKELKSDLRMLSSDGGGLLKGYIQTDPTGEMLHLLDQAQGRSLLHEIHGVWFSTDEKRALLVAQFGKDTTIGAEQGALAEAKRDFTRAQHDVAGSANTRLMLTGPATFTISIRDHIRKDAARFSAIAAILVALILISFYRSFRVLAYGLLPVLSGALAGIAAVSLAFGTVHGVTLGFGITLIGEAVDYPIYLFTQSLSGATPKETLSRIWPTLRLGVLTSICGFGALLFSSFSGLAQLGLFTITGLISAVSVTRWVLPEILPSAFRIFQRRRLDIFIRSVVVEFLPRCWPAGIALLLTAMAILFAHRSNLWDDNLESLTPIPQAEKKIDQQLRSQLGAPDAGYLIVVTGRTLEEALQTSERVSVMLMPLIEAGKVSSFEVANTYLPSEATQKRRQAAIPDREELADRIERAAKTLSFKPGVFSSFVAQASRAKTKPLLNLASLKDTSFDIMVHDLVSDDNGRWELFVPLRGVTDPDAISSAIRQSAMANVIFLDIKKSSDALYQTYREEAVLLSVCGVAAILLLLGSVLRSWGRLIQVIVPLACAILVTSAILISASHGLSLFHLIGLLLTVAVGSNYSLFFERKTHENESQGSIAASVSLANVCTITGFGVLAFSSIYVLHAIGLTVAIGTFCSLIFSAMLVRFFQGNQR